MVIRYMSETTSNMSEKGLFFPNAVNEEETSLVIQHQEVQ